MQRAPWSRSSACGSSSTNSLKSSIRSGIGRFRGSWRWSFRKPPSSPIPGKHLPLGLLLDLRLLALLAPVSRLPRAMRRGRGVLVLPGLARLGRLEPVARGRVLRALTGAHRPGAVAIAVLGDHRWLAGVDRSLLLALAQHALVIHRHDLDPDAAQRVPLVEHARRDLGPSAVAMLLDQRAHLGEVILG